MTSLEWWKALPEVNHAQLVATKAGEVMVPTYDWAGFFEVPFKQMALRGIKSYHHFKLDAIHPGVVEVQEGTDEMSKKLKLLTDPTRRPPSHDLPTYPFVCLLFFGLYVLSPFLVETNTRTSPFM